MRNSAHHKIWKKNLQLNRSCCWMLSSAIVVTGIGWSFVKLCFDWIWYTCHVCDLFFAMLHSCRNQHGQDWFKDIFYTENGPYLFHLLSFVCSFCLLYRSLVSSSVHPCAKNNKSFYSKKNQFLSDADTVWFAGREEEMVVQQQTSHHKHWLSVLFEKKEEFVVC